VNPRVYAAAVYLIGAALILSTLGIVLLAWDANRSIPDVLQNIAIGSLTGLAGLLSAPRGTRAT
jgi:hypothetical protein